MKTGKYCGKEKQWIKFGELDWQLELSRILPELGTGVGQKFSLPFGKIILTLVLPRGYMHTVVSKQSLDCRIVCRANQNILFLLKFLKRVGTRAFSKHIIIFFNVGSLFELKVSLTLKQKQRKGSSFPYEGSLHSSG